MNVSRPLTSRASCCAWQELSIIKLLSSGNRETSPWKRSLFLDQQMTLEEYVSLPILLFQHEHWWNDKNQLTRGADIWGMAHIKWVTSGSTAKYQSPLCDYYRQNVHEKTQSLMWQYLQVWTLLDGVINRINILIKETWERSLHFYQERTQWENGHPWTRNCFLVEPRSYLIWTCQPSEL